MFKAVLSLVKAEGPSGLTSAVWRRVRPHRLREFPQWQPYFAGKVGLELGGPTRLFGRGGSLPVYPLAGRIDNCNFGAQTVWEGTINEGDTFVFNPGSAPGRQFIGEAGDLGTIGDGSYDFVLSSHCLEHLANPLCALGEWKRVLRPDGLLVLIVPHKDGTFDHRRPTTTLAHLVADRDQGTDEGDLTHLDEILRLHDLKRDPGAGDRHTFEERSRGNREHRCLHHHVFDMRLAVDVVDHLGLRILAAEAFRPFHIAVVAQKSAPGATVDNARFTTAGAELRSPFPSDRVAGH
jgi:SAM-dependent methyltransferase